MVPLSKSKEHMNINGIGSSHYFPSSVHFLCIDMKNPLKQNIICPIIHKVWILSDIHYLNITTWKQKSIFKMISFLVINRYVEIIYYAYLVWIVWLVYTFLFLRPYHLWCIVFSKLNKNCTYIENVKLLHLV